jgi:hypothetical protein
MDEVGGEGCCSERVRELGLYELVEAWRRGREQKKKVMRNSIG